VIGRARSGACARAIDRALARAAAQPLRGPRAIGQVEPRSLDLPRSGLT